MTEFPDLSGDGGFPGDGDDPGDVDGLDAATGGLPVGPGGAAQSGRPGPPPAPEFYIAVLVTESTSEETGHRPLYEETFVLVSATDEQEAQEKARQYGRQQELTYQDEHDQEVTWKLRHVVEVKRVEDTTFDDGTELYSRFFRDYDSYARFDPTLSGEEI